MKPIPTLRQLRYLIAVVDRRHFSQAAEECLVSQSTLSAAIQELEDLLGAPLLERTKRSVIPTALGREIAGRAREILRGAEDLVDIAHAANDPAAGPLHLGVIPTVGPFLLPRAMPLLRRALPRLRLYLREDQTARLLDQLTAGTLDAAVIALPYPAGELEAMEIADDPFWVVCPPGHTLCTRRPVSSKDMAFEDLLLLEDGHCLRDHVLAACELEGARRNAGFQGTSLHTLVEMVANGIGVTLLPQMALDAGILRGLDLNAVPLEGRAASRRIGLVWRRSSGRQEIIRRVGAELRKAMSEPAIVTTSQAAGATTYSTTQPDA